MLEAYRQWRGYGRASEYPILKLPDPWGNGDHQQEVLDHHGLKDYLPRKDSTVPSYVLRELVVDDKFELKLKLYLSGLWDPALKQEIERMDFRFPTPHSVYMESHDTIDVAIAGWQSYGKVCIYAVIDPVSFRIDKYFVKMRFKRPDETGMGPLDENGQSMLYAAAYWCWPQ